MLVPCLKSPASGKSVLGRATFKGGIFSLTSRYNSLKNNEVLEEAGHDRDDTTHSVGRSGGACTDPRRASGGYAQGNPHRLGDLQSGVAGAEAEGPSGEGVRQGRH